MVREDADLNSDERKYRVNGTNIETVSPKQPTFAPYWTQDAAELLGDSNPVARSRTGSDRQRRTAAAASSSLGMYARPRQNNQCSYESWHNKEITWEMAEKDRDYALARREL